MSDYSRNYNFAVKDGLTTGNPAKLIKGSEVDDELDDVATAIATKANTSDGVVGTLLTTRGDVVTRGASVSQRVALGAAGEVLSSDGTDAVWGSPWLLVSDTILSTDDDVEWTIEAGYTYRALGFSVIPSTTGLFQWLAKVGGAYKTTNEYLYIYDAYGTDASDATADVGLLSVSAGANVADFEVVFYNAASATYATFSRSSCLQSGGSAQVVNRENTAETATNLKIEHSVGTLNTGRIIIERMRESWA